MSKRSNAKSRSTGTRKNTSTGVHAHILESLERRALLDASLPFTAYYPEGFVHDGISEFVPITNSGDTEVQYELHARYETGERDQLVAAGTIAPHSRGGVTLNTAGDPASRLVRPDAPYALELRASGPVGATMSHYDFGTAIGESFTQETALEWSFADGYKNPEGSRDFLVFYNPTDEDAVVATIIYSGDGTTIPLVSTIGAGRRGGWNLNNEAAIPHGSFSVQVVSSVPIVAAQSHYEINSGRGFGLIGTPNGGSTAGVIPSITYDANNRGASDADPANAFVSFLNHHKDFNANVAVSFIPMNGGEAPPDAFLSIAPGARGGVSVRDQNLPPGEYGVIYRSDLPVTATASVYQGPDGTGMQAITTASERWEFGEGFMSPARAGSTVTEDLFLFNPGSEAVEATVDFSFSDGKTLSVTRLLEPTTVHDVNIHDIPEIAQLGHDAFYGIRVTAPEPIAASFEHWDDDLGGGFSTPGTPTAATTPMTTIPIA